MGAAAGPPSHVCAYHHVWDASHVCLCVMAAAADAVPHTHGGKCACSVVLKRAAGKQRGRACILAGAPS